MMALTLCFYGICAISLVKLYDHSLNKYLIPYSLFNRLIPISLIAATVLHFAGLGFTFVSMPIALAVTFPLLYLSLKKIIPNWHNSDNFERVFAVIILLNSLHFLDFPFLRMNSNFAPIGFALAFIFMFVFTVFLPMFISLYLERKNILSLENKVKKRTLQLNRVKEEKAQLLNVLCHDIATPLMVIELHLKKVSKESNSGSKITKSFERSRFALKNLKGILEQVRRMSSIEEGKQIIEFEDFKVSNLIRNCEELHADLIERKGLVFTSENLYPLDDTFHGNEQIIFTDIISNFITNSIKFTDSGGLINLRLEGDKQNLKIIISDTGAGMEEQSIQAIYDNVKKSETGTKGEKGTGLGLSIALFYLRKFNASVHINSRPVNMYPDNSGTDITLTFKTTSK